MASLNRICFLRLMCIIFVKLDCFISIQADANRCGYAITPSMTDTVWRKEGDDVTVNCTGYIPIDSKKFTIEYYWYSQEYDCHGMDEDMLIAYCADYLGGGTRVKVKDERMTINKESGTLTIRNLTLADEQTLTCLFHDTKEYVATVHLKIKEFLQPVLTGLTDYLAENEERNVQCRVPKMYPTKGAIEVKHNDKIKASVKLVNELLSVVVQIIGKADASENNVTCTAIQNVTGAEEQLSATSTFTVLYSYYTKVTSSSGEQPTEFSDVTLTCNETRKGNPSQINQYIWLKDGFEIPGLSAGTILIRNITKDRSGTYQCLISNSPNTLTPRSEAKGLQLDVVVPQNSKSTLSKISIAGYVILGCVAFAVLVGITCVAKCSGSKKRQSQKINRIYQDYYEDLDTLDACTKFKHEATVQRNTLITDTPASVKVGKLQVAYGTTTTGLNNSTPTPPLPPDVRNIPSCQSLDHLCPETELHYNNRMAIMATIPRKTKKSRLSFDKTVSLGELLDQCKDGYGALPAKSQPKEISIVNGDYVDMTDSAVRRIKAEIHRDWGNHVMTVDKDSGSVIQKKESDPQASEIYMDMNGVKA